MNIEHVLGDATKPIGEDWRNKLIVHCCNDIGKWGAGFVLALNKRWDEPYKRYNIWYARKQWQGVPFKLGQIQTVQVEQNIWVCNLIGQSGVGHFRELPPIRYGGIYEGLIRVREVLDTIQCREIHLPKMGSGLAGGDWQKIEKIVKDVFSLSKIAVFVYEFRPGE